ncbi:hypothetical protein BDV12DRAFT_199803 [Aspergillus spectabilis]
MHPEFTAPHPPEKPTFKRPPVSIRSVRVSRWSLPLLATIAIGYGVTHYNPIKTNSPSPSQLAEIERLKKNQQLMDAYGYRDNVDDLQKAMEAYEVQ